MNGDDTGMPLRDERARLLAAMAVEETRMRRAVRCWTLARAAEIFARHGTVESFSWTQYLSRDDWRGVCIQDITIDGVEMAHPGRGEGSFTSRPDEALPDYYFGPTRLDIDGAGAADAKRPGPATPGSGMTVVNEVIGAFFDAIDLFGAPALLGVVESSVRVTARRRIACTPGGRARRIGAVLSVGPA